MHRTTEEPGKGEDLFRYEMLEKYLLSGRLQCVSDVAQLRCTIDGRVTKSKNPETGLPHSFAVYLGVHLGQGALLEEEVKSYETLRG